MAGRSQDGSGIKNRGALALTDCTVCNNWPGVGWDGVGFRDRGEGGLLKALGNR